MSAETNTGKGRLSFGQTSVEKRRSSFLCSFVFVWVVEVARQHLSSCKGSRFGSQHRTQLSQAPGPPAPGELILLLPQAPAAYMGTPTHRGT